MVSLRTKTVVEVGIPQTRHAAEDRAPIKDQIQTTIWILTVTMKKVIKLR